MENKNSFLFIKLVLLIFFLPVVQGSLLDSITMGGCGGKEAAKPQNSSSSPPRRPPDKVEKVEKPQPVARKIVNEQKEQLKREQSLRKANTPTGSKSNKLNRSNSSECNSLKHVDPVCDSQVGSPKSPKKEDFSDVDTDKHQPGSPQSPHLQESVSSCMVFDIVTSPPEETFQTEHERQMSLGPPKREV